MTKKRRCEQKPRVVNQQAGTSGLELLPLDVWELIAKKLVATDELRNTQVLAGEILGVLSTCKALYRNGVSDIFWNCLAASCPTTPPCPLNIDFQPLSLAVAAPTTAPTAEPAPETRLPGLKRRRRGPPERQARSSEPASWKSVADMLSLDPSRFSTKALRSALVALGVEPAYWANAEELEAVLSERLKHSGQPPMQVVLEVRRQAHTYLSASAANHEYRLTPTMLIGLTRVEPLAFHGTRDAFRLLDVVRAAQRHFGTADALRRRQELVAAAAKSRSASRAALRQARFQQMAMAWFGNEALVNAAVGPVDEDGICPECGVPWRDHY